MSAPKQATTEVKKELTDIINDNQTKIVLDNGKIVKLGWLRPDTQDKLNDLIIEAIGLHAVSMHRVLPLCCLITFGDFVCFGG